MKKHPEHRDFLGRVLELDDKVIWPIMRPGGGMYKCVVVGFTRSQVWVVVDGESSKKRTYPDLLITYDQQEEDNKHYEMIRNPLMGEDTGHGAVEYFAKKGIDAIIWAKVFRETSSVRKARIASRIKKEDS